MATLPVAKQARPLESSSRPPSKRWRRNTAPESCAYCAEGSPLTTATIAPSSASPTSENKFVISDLPPITPASADSVMMSPPNAWTPTNPIATTTSPWYKNPNNICNSNEICFNLHNNKKDSTTPELPDEVLVAVLRFVPSAATLWKLRAVCRHWRNIIDSQSCVWRHVSFKGILFNRSVVISPNAAGNISKNKVLTLGPRQGASAVALAATAGNEWASFLSMCLFGTVPLKALTVAQPLANQLVSASTSGNNNVDDVSIFETRERPPDTNYKHGWVVIHAARRGPQDLPRGALVGMIRVCGSAQNGNNQWSWKIVERLKLKLPLRCAGYVGLWSLSRPLTEILVRALHTQ